MYAIQTDNLTKKYGSATVVNGVSMHVDEGTIYGLIGNNGAGKTTLFKMLLGLAIQSDGCFQLFEKGGISEIEEIRRNIGSLIEAPAMQPNMNAFDNLKAAALGAGCFDKVKIQSILQTVNLDKTPLKYKNFSLGMKQRLGIGAALLGDPKLLILDEPTNGLDPSGIMEMRELILRLNREFHKTVLISSHIISELSKVAGTYGIMCRGKLVKELTPSDLAAISRPMLKIVVNDVLKASEILREVLKVKDFSTFPNNTIKLYELTDHAQTVSKELAVGGVLVLSIDHQDNDLENYFISLMGGSANA